METSLQLSVVTGDTKLKIKVDRKDDYIELDEVTRVETSSTGTLKVWRGNQEIAGFQAGIWLGWWIDED